MSLIDANKPLTVIYHELLVDARKIQVERDSGSLPCVHCKKPHIKHGRDGRCDSYATSLHFRSEQLDRLNEILDALGHIEALMKVK